MIKMIFALIFVLTAVSSYAADRPKVGDNIKNVYTKIAVDREKDLRLYIKGSSIKKVKDNYTVNIIIESDYGDSVTGIVGKMKINCDTVSYYSYTEGSNREHQFPKVIRVKRIGTYNYDGMHRYLNGHEMGYYGDKDCAFNPDDYMYKLKEIVCENQPIVEIK